MTTIPVGQFALVTAIEAFGLVVLLFTIWSMSATTSRLRRENEALQETERRRALSMRVKLQELLDEVPR